MALEETKAIYLHKIEEVLNPSRVYYRPSELDHESQFDAKLQCLICSHIPIMGVTACECTTCSQIYCEPCLIRKYSNVLENKDQSVGCDSCHAMKFPFYKKQLSEQNSELFQSHFATCSFKDLNCDSMLPLSGIGLKDHESSCIEICKLCNKRVPSCVKSFHFLYEGSCSGFQSEDSRLMFKEGDINEIKMRQLDISKLDKQTYDKISGIHRIEHNLATIKLDDQEEVNKEKVLCKGKEREMRELDDSISTLWILTAILSLVIVGLTMFNCYNEQVKMHLKTEMGA